MTDGHCECFRVVSGLPFGARSSPLGMSAGWFTLLRPQAAAQLQGVGETTIMENVSLPPHLQDVFFDTRWETTKVWALRTPVTTMSLEELAWLLELSVWSSVAGEARFDLTPRAVLSETTNYSRHWNRICDVSLEYPLDLFLKGGRWVIVDGYHRLAKHWLQSTGAVPVRLHPAAFWREIRPRTHGSAAHGS